jgi:DMSO/TMAO reductase YedYZ molybdopterin-dependent catalytic subunit
LSAALPPGGALPPNQQATRRWPVVGEREPEPFDPATWTLEVRGLAASPLALRWEEFRALPRIEAAGTIHCVTRWSRPGSRFSGVPLRALLDRVRPAPGAHWVRFASGRGHDTTLPLDLAGAEVLVADAEGGAPIAPEHGGPVRSVCLPRYFYKSVKWLRTVELLAANRPGFWERTAGYHDGADPWREERYALPDLDRRTLERLLAARDLAGRDLRGASLEGRDLRGFSFRASRIRDGRFAGADLRDADFSGANLTNADLRGCDLRGARLEGTDLDGADLRGADLRGARIGASSMACASFCGPGGSDPAALDGASLEGADASGLLEEQREFLRARGFALPGD